MQSRLITLLTDFGHTDPFVGTMKGVILGINPSAVIIDLTHEVSPMDILQGAFLLGTAWHHFPAGTIHIAVVDPGVGTQRRVLAVEVHDHTFLVPDNGLLSFILPNEAISNSPFKPYLQDIPSSCSATVLTNAKFWNNPVSSTFHGRDIFAPVAGYLALGEPRETMGNPVKSVTQLALPGSRWLNGNLSGYVIHIDRFGNIVTTVSAASVENMRISIHINGGAIAELTKTYGSGHGLVAHIGSHGYIEIAVANGNAAEFLKARVGDKVLVRKT